MDNNELLIIKEMMSHKGSNRIPEPGFHIAKVLEVATEPNSLNTGSLMKIKCEILEGKSKGIIIKDSINIIHNDGYTQKKGQSWLYYFNLACGFEPGYYPSSTDEYIGRKLKIQLSDKKGEAFTVLRYEPVGGHDEKSILSSILKIFKHAN